MLIKPEHIANYAQFSLNVPATHVEPYIRNTEALRLIPIIGDAMYADLNALYANFIGVWDNTTNYAVNDVVSVNNGVIIEVYQAVVANTGINPIGNPATWQLKELGVLFENYIKPFASLATMREFLVFHGINVTQFGLRVPDESTSLPADGATRGRMIDQIKTHEQAYLNKLKNYLCDKNWTFDSIKYTVDCGDYKSKSKIRVSSL